MSYVASKERKHLYVLPYSNVIERNNMKLKNKKSLSNCTLIGLTTNKKRS